MYPLSISLLFYVSLIEKKKKQLKIIAEISNQKIELICNQPPNLIDNLDL